jgi:hypothetical protein
MKVYVVFINGRVIGRVPAENLREAERQAKKRFGPKATVAIS